MPTRAAIPAGTRRPRKAVPVVSVTSEEVAAICASAVSAHSAACLEPVHSVPLSLVGPSWALPPTIGEIEHALVVEGRVHHRIARIEVGSTYAVAHVHPDDVAGCVGVLGQGDKQLTVSVLGGASVGLGMETAMATAVPSPAPAIAMAIESPAPAIAIPVESPAPPPAPAPPQAASAPPPKKRAKTSAVGSVSVSAVGEVVGAAATATAAIVGPPPLVTQLSDPQDDTVAAAFNGDFSELTDAQRRDQEKKEARLYRVGLSYRCGRCGQPKKGHVCNVPDGEEGAAAGADGAQLSPTPAILATTVRKGTPPSYLGSPLAVVSPASAHAAAVSVASPGAAATHVTVISPIADVKVSGEATTIFKDMVAALGSCAAENGGAAPGSLASPGGGSTPPQMVSSSHGISPLAASAIAAGSVSNAACAVAAPFPAAGSGAAPSVSAAGEPHLSEMDLMLADLAFAARPPPVITPDEGADAADATADTVANGLGSLSPSNFSPGAMIQQLVTAAPGSTGSLGWSTNQMAELGSNPGSAVLCNPVVAQPSA